MQEKNKYIFENYLKKFVSTEWAKVDTGGCA